MRSHPTSYANPRSAIHSSSLHVIHSGMSPRSKAILPTPYCYRVFTRSSKRPALARVFWIHLLEVCWTFAGSCKHPIRARKRRHNWSKLNWTGPLVSSVQFSCVALYSGFYPYNWWALLAPSKKRRGSFVKGVDQNFPLFFAGQSTVYTVNNTSSLERGRSPKEGRTWAQKWTGTCARFRFQI